MEKDKSQVEYMQERLRTYFAEETTKMEVDVDAALYPGELENETEGLFFVPIFGIERCFIRFPF